MKITGKLLALTLAFLTLLCSCNNKKTTDKSYPPGGADPGDQTGGFYAGCGTSAWSLGTGAAAGKAMESWQCRWNCWKLL